jgi:hypothetical protein
MAATTDEVQSLKGMLRKPGKPVSIEEMNQAIAKQFDMDEWDREIARDSELRRLDKFAEEAIAGYKAGCVKKLR